MITPTILLDPPPTLLIRTLLPQLPNQLATRLVLHLANRAIRPIIVLGARLAPMPRHAVVHAKRRTTRHALEFRIRCPVVVDLARRTPFCHAPRESWDCFECGPRAQRVVAAEGAAGAEGADVGVREDLCALGTGDVGPEVGGELDRYPVFEASSTCVGGMGAGAGW